DLRWREWQPQRDGEKHGVAEPDQTLGVNYAGELSKRSALVPSSGRVIRARPRQARRGAARPRRGRLPQPHASAARAARSSRRRARRTSRPHAQTYGRADGSLGANVGAIRPNDFPRKANGHEQADGDHPSPRTDPDNADRLTGIYGSVRLGVRVPP